MAPEYRSNAHARCVVAGRRLTTPVIRWIQRPMMRSHRRGRLRICHAASRRLRVLLAAVAFFLPAAAGAQALQADLDGDGIRDLVVRGSRPTDLFLQLSRTSQPQQLRLPQPIVQITSGDIDEDGDADLLATTAGPGVDIFVNQGGGHFQALHPIAVQLSGAARALIDADRSGPPSDNLSDAPLASVALPPRAARAPSPTPVIRRSVSSSPLRFLPRGIDPRGPPALSIRPVHQG